MVYRRAALVSLAVVVTVACVAALIAAPTAEARASNSTSTTHYEVTGSTLAKLRRSITKHGPEGFAGYTDWRITWRYTLTSNADWCRIATSSVSLSINHTYPRWRDEDAAADEVQDRWETFISRLKVHERGHGRIATTGAAALKRTLRSIARQHTCPEVTQRITRAGNGQVRKSQAADTAYDERTDHGAKQGATL